MSFTNFPNGITSFGLPVVGSAPMIPAGGNHYWVHPAIGSDSNDGSAPTARRAMATVRAAYTKTRDGYNDCVHLVGNGVLGGGAMETATITWANSACHLIGHCAPTMIGQRARIGTLSTATAPAVIMTVSGNGCMFYNVEWINEYHTADVAHAAVACSGQRNWFGNCQISGMAHATAGDRTGGTSLDLTGGDECTFEHCYIGLDTIPRSTTNTEILLAGHATRNIFRSCFIAAYADNAGHYFVSAPSTASIDRYAWFHDCIFYNAVGSAATTMTVAMKVAAAAGGLILLTGSTVVFGATDWADDFTSVRQLLMPNASSNFNTVAGLGIAPA